MTSSVTRAVENSSDLHISTIVMGTEHMALPYEHKMYS